MATLRIPPSLPTWGRRLVWCEKARERLRRFHNARGALYREGKLSEKEWQVFLEWFKPRNAAISEALSEQRRAPREAAQGLPDDDPELSRIDLQAIFK